MDAYHEQLCLRVSSIDDIQDNTKFRRGLPSAHKVFGVAQTINSANYVYFEAQQHLLNLPDWPKAMKTFNEEMMNLHRGQGMELYWRDTNQPPSEAGYLQMISNKTGGLFRLILRLLQAMSSVEIDASKLIDVIGLMFQILDDLKSVCDEKVGWLPTLMPSRLYLTKSPRWPRRKAFLMT